MSKDFYDDDPKPKAKKAAAKKEEEAVDVVEPSAAKVQAYAKDKRSLSEPKSWSVQACDDGQYAVIDDEDGKVTSKWPTQDAAQGQVNMLEEEDKAGRSTT